MIIQKKYYALIMLSWCSLRGGDRIELLNISFYLRRFESPHQVLPAVMVKDRYAELKFQRFDKRYEMSNEPHCANWCSIQKRLPLIRDELDDYLEVDKDSLLRPLWGAYYSTIKAFTLTPDQALQELVKIELILSKLKCKKSQYPSLFYEEIKKRHWYIDYVLNAVITHEESKFYAVKGSTIDSLLAEEKQISSLSLDLSRFIHMKARERYREIMYFGLGYGIYERIDFVPAKMCKTAFCNCRDDLKELIALRGSKTMKAFDAVKIVSDDRFRTYDQIKNQIEERITELKQQHKQQMKEEK